jgi:hypothetical protein
MTYACRNREYLAGAIGCGLAVLPYDEKTIEHQSSNIVIVGVFGIRGSCLKRFGLNLGVSGSL